MVLDFISPHFHGSQGLGLECRVGPLVLPSFFLCDGRFLDVFVPGGGGWTVGSGQWRGHHKIIFHACGELIISEVMFYVLGDEVSFGTFRDGITYLSPHLRKFPV